MFPASERVLLKLAFIMLGLAASFPVVLFSDWPRILRLPGALAALGSPAYMLLAVWELVRYQRAWRVWMAFSLLALSTLIVWSVGISYGLGHFH